MAPLLTDVMVNEYPQYVPGKYRRLRDSTGNYIMCSMPSKSGNGKPCRYYSNGRFNGAPVCSGHFQTDAYSKKQLLKKVIKLKECEEMECPVCMETFTATNSSTCGHKVCSSCCRQMKDSGRTMSCPLCRDMRFIWFVELTCM